MSADRGLVVWQGPSRLDGGPIVAIVTLGSLNAKTGDMAQAWILRWDVTPHDAIVAGTDRSICGDCVHRSGGAVGRSCYVVWWQSPTTVYKAFVQGAYRTVAPLEAARALEGRAVRLAAYGDPAAVPFEIWRTLLVHVRHYTAYTHQWRTCDQRFAAIAMASVESEPEADQAHRLGWRTFRTRLAIEGVRADELVCPASDEAGHRVTCVDCGLCVGQQRPTARSIAIIAHGQRVTWLQQKKAEVAG